MIPIISTLALEIGMQRSKTSAPLPVKVDQFEVYYRQVTFKCNALLRSHNDDLCQLQCLLFALIAIFPSFFSSLGNFGCGTTSLPRGVSILFFFLLSETPAGYPATLFSGYPTVSRVPSLEGKKNFFLFETEFGRKCVKGRKSVRKKAMRTVSA